MWPGGVEVRWGLRAEDRQKTQANSIFFTRRLFVRLRSTRAEDKTRTKYKTQGYKANYRQNLIGRLSRAPQRLWPQVTRLHLHKICKLVICILHIPCKRLCGYRSIKDIVLGYSRIKIKIVPYIWHEYSLVTRALVRISQFNSRIRVWMDHEFVKTPVKLVCGIIPCFLLFRVSLILLY